MRSAEQSCAGWIIARLQAGAIAPIDDQPKAVPCAGIENSAAHRRHTVDEYWRGNRDIAERRRDIIDAHASTGRSAPAVIIGDGDGNEVEIRRGAAGIIIAVDMSGAESQYAHIQIDN